VRFKYASTRVVGHTVGFEGEQVVRREYGVVDRPCLAKVVTSVAIGCSVSIADVDSVGRTVLRGQWKKVLLIARLWGAGAPGLVSSGFFGSLVVQSSTTFDALLRLTPLCAPTPFAVMVMSLTVVILLLRERLADIGLRRRALSSSIVSSR
jgi:hypothetical protein